MKKKIWLALAIFKYSKILLRMLWMTWNTLKKKINMSPLYPFVISRVSIIREAASLTCKLPLVWNQLPEHCLRLQEGTLAQKKTEIFSNVSLYLIFIKDFDIGLISNEKKRFSDTGLSNVSEISRKSSK